MKKKIVAMCATVAIAAVAVGGTLAYFSAQSEVAENVMTTGSVSIIQHEEDRAGNKFDQSQELLPYTGPVGENGMASGFGSEKYDNWYGLFDDDKNAIDKIVTVENTGSMDAYVRTLFAYELKADGTRPFNTDLVINAVQAGSEIMPVAKNAADGSDVIITDKDGVQYLVCEYYYGYDSIVKSGKISHPSLLQVYMNANLNSDDAAELVGTDGKYKILVLSQAVQTEGFDDAQTALDTAFGDVNNENCAVWFNPVVE